jgi:hypothetical protein
MECSDEDEAIKITSELPLIIARLMDIEIMLLLPLGTLIGHKLTLQE